LIVDMRHRPQAFFRLLMISAKLGLFPYINIYILKILMARKSPAIMESPNTPILVMICHNGISDIPNLNMLNLGGDRCASIPDGDQCFLGADLT